MSTWTEASKSMIVTRHAVKYAKFRGRREKLLRQKGDKSLATNGFPELLVVLTQFQNGHWDFQQVALSCQIDVLQHV